MIGSGEVFVRIRTRIVVFLGVSAFIVPLIGLLGKRLGLWTYEIGFLLLMSGAALGALTVVAGIVGLLIVLLGKRNDAIASRLANHWPNIAGFILGLVVVVFVLKLFLNALQYPLLYDISTDLEDPPTFSAAIGERRGESSNSLAFTAQAAQLHAESYPDVDTLVILNKSRSESFELAMSVARDMDWTFVTANSESGRFEAVATTFWFGFQDDVVVRVRANSKGPGSLIDVRSASRVGVSDIGTNARRIRRFLSEIESRLASRES